ncbi:hypothetical protein XI06_30415 [Bradyrhizobium sp. CCBAU 11434]|uniref:hypothetical protein n=1 Tax=Bradyrhizobium sp. CCBAU 11434 TaxID=1630885 RepID=UPI0023050651|nr:hypothetical protein [Bradyrhizobium sp. CCBAU 11434]MDA9524485.1 hypothetical protein [Bradyrhizobium sp. CCBAU 11434]
MLLVASGVAVSAILAFVFSWNYFLFAMVLANGDNRLAERHSPHFRQRFFGVQRMPSIPEDLFAKGELIKPVLALD